MSHLRDAAQTRTPRGSGPEWAPRGAASGGVGRSGVELSALGLRRGDRGPGGPQPRAAFPVPVR